MPTIEEQAAADEVLDRLTLQQQEAGPDNPDTRLTLQRSAATTLSGVLSPWLEGEGSNHPQAAHTQHTATAATTTANTAATQLQQIQLRTQPSRQTSAAQVCACRDVAGLVLSTCCVLNQLFTSASQPLGGPVQA